MTQSFLNTTDHQERRTINTMLIMSSHSETNAKCKSHWFLRI